MIIIIVVIITVIIIIITTEGQECDRIELVNILMLNVIMVTQQQQ